MLSFPIALRILFAAHSELLTPVLRSVHRVVTRFLIEQAGLKRHAADTGAVTLIQRYGSAANLNIRVQCLVLDGVYRRTEGEPVFLEARAPSRAELQGLLDKSIARPVKLLTRKGYLVEEEGRTDLTDIDADKPLASLQGASWPCRPRRARGSAYRIAFGPRAGQQVLSLHTVASRDRKNTAVLCADAHGFSLHAAVRVDSDQRKALERLCGTITRPAIANERLSRNRKGQVVLQLKSPYRDGTTQVMMSPQLMHAA